MAQKEANKPTSIDSDEIAKFAAMANDWWNPNGKFRPLHKFNPTRLRFIKEKVLSHFNRQDGIRPFEGLNFIDIGSGGGLLSEPMNRLGANVTGIDATEKNVQIAKAHLLTTNAKVDYRHTTVEEICDKEQEKYDVVLNMEVIEHVANPKEFLLNSAKLLKKGGIMFVATINRTMKAKALAIFAAENILRWLPAGTHDFDKLLKPEELKDFVAENSELSISEPFGVSYSPLWDKWSLSDDISMNYMVIIHKK